MHAVLWISESSWHRRIYCICVHWTDAVFTVLQLENIGCQNASGKWTVEGMKELLIFTVNHKKRATLFLIITLAFLVRFLYFLYQWKQEGILHKQLNKICHFTLTVSPHYLVKLKRRINSTFWSQSSYCVRPNRLFATFAESRPMFVFSNFWQEILLSVFW